MKLTFCGAAGTTTGSHHLVEVNGCRLLLDCGLFQGRRRETWERNQTFAFDPKSLDAVILSHAHIDHSGNLPNLVKQGFSGNVYATFATRDLCQIMLADSAKIQQADADFLNKRRAKQGLDPITPLYNAREAEYALRNFVALDYHRRLPIGDGVWLEFYDAGHILGSAQILLHIEDRSDGRTKRLLFSGDIGRKGNDLLRDPEPVADVDLLLMESTYGGREHERPTDARDALCRLINEARTRGGKILIPAFAVERTQQVLYTLHQILESRCIEPIPVYVDSPLAVSATEVFRLHPECFNEEVYAFLFERRDPFGFDNLTLIRDVKASMALNDLPGPAIIISSSGMCEAGRILHHLRTHMGNPATTILFVGYCAPETLGWKIRNGDKTVNIFGETFENRAAVEGLDSFSGHADNSELLDYFRALGGPKRKVWLVHGGPERSAALVPQLREISPESQVVVAEHLGVAEG
ncbi:MAG: MBL fold metallo-hydrolase [Candidatus Methylacidiphilales bacterium]